MVHSWRNVFILNNNKGDGGGDFGTYDYVEEEHEDEETSCF